MNQQESQKRIRGWMLYCGIVCLLLPLSGAQAKTPERGAKLYATVTQPFWLSADTRSPAAGQIQPSTEIRVLKPAGDNIYGEIEGWQQEGAESVIYAALGKRILKVQLDREAQGRVKLSGGTFNSPAGQRWRQVSLAVWLPKARLTRNQNKIWHDAANLMSAQCNGCHAPIPLNQFTANQWPRIMKSMAPRTSLTQEQLGLLTQYAQQHAKDR